jgi:hypothetical protein
MKRAVQITFDAVDPGALARFWAQALGYVVEPPPAGHDSWASFLGSIGVPPEQHNRASAVVPPDGGGPRVFFQRVRSAEQVVNRVHLDVTVGTAASAPERRAQIDAEAARLVDLGASRHRMVDRPNEFWVVLKDPEGNAFCLQ